MFCFSIYQSVSELDLIFLLISECAILIIAPGSLMVLETTRYGNFLKFPQVKFAKHCQMIFFSILRPQLCKVLKKHMRSPGKINGLLMLKYLAELGSWLLT
ncbi:hypothetical protein KIL84_017389 [Mauremys mutica]|uniref:Uncharacterized protein n=1 Tax=Mauremys mutica TaxID=74926 RepID=A0A9D4AYL7_9SAUR|nr:hypothetical protein KIL84_017389 [Mauremys mutica]